MSELLPATLSLKELHEALKQRGVALSYPVLCKFIQVEEVSRLLHVGGAGNRREIEPETVDTLARFLTIFRDSGAKWPKAPSMLARFLQQSSQVSPTEELVAASTGSPLLRSEELTELRAIRELLQQRELPPPDKLIPIRQAHEEYHVSMAALRRLQIKEGGRWKVKESALLAYIASL